MGYKTDCRLFTGYKPCVHKIKCDGCPHYDKIQSHIGIVSLEAMGAVLRSTVLLEPIKRRFPHAYITWITLKNVKPLLNNNPHIDKIICLEPKTQSAVEMMEFDALFAVDKSMEAGALAMKLNAKQKFGFGMDKRGVIIPLSKHADYQYDVGLDDNLKFFENQKPETQQLTESMNLEWQRDPYVLELTKAEHIEVDQRREKILEETDGATKFIGYNTGCSVLFPYKKFTIDKAIELIAQWRRKFPDAAVLLLGGPEDSERQQQIKAHFKSDARVVNTPTTQGLRSGVLWMALSDLVFSGCSLGLHIAIALKKPSIAWFGVSCSQEIDLYDKGEKIIASVPCTPCWKKSCTNEPKCFDMVGLDGIMNSTERLLAGSATS
ncbi:MAG: glycosyltransferase family 9 protein [Pseudobacteriovorax sp.]|nr:glycosyltransferase family 9 protein [Pseudobacteriovorax sp.]